MPICTNSIICETETAFLIIIVKLSKIIEKYNNNKNNHPYIKSGGSHKSDLDFDKTQFTQISQVISQWEGAWGMEWMDEDHFHLWGNIAISPELNNTD